MTTENPTQSEGAKAFLAWAREAAVPVSIPRTDEDFADLAFLPEAIGEARIVALGESAHYMHEWNRFRARLFKFLALEHGFRVFVLESGLVEGRNLYQYVLGADIDWDTVVGSVTNAWGVWAELQELLTWMREENAKAPDAPPYRFYTMDGSANWAHARIAADAVLGYVKRVDPDLHDALYPDLGETARGVDMDHRAAVPEGTWDRVIAQSSRALSKLEQSRLAYVERSSAEDYDWAVRTTRVLRDLLLAFAQTELDFSLGFKTFWNVRDVAMAHQLRWIVEREGLDAGFVVGAHNNHLQQYPVRGVATSMGAYLMGRQVPREKVLLIGAANTYTPRGDEPVPDANQAVYDRVGPETFFIDLRKAPASGPARAWLDAPRPDRHNLRYQQIAPGIAWDCLLFHRRVAIAEPALPPGIERPEGRADLARLDDYVGKYVVIGFLEQPNRLRISRDGDRLVSDGLEDTSGELFPSLPSPLVPTDDGRFGWANWPAYLEFVGPGRVEEVRISMPGMGLYFGKRVS